MLQVLLKDPRVDVLLPDTGHRTPFWVASYLGYDEVCRWLIASARDLGDVENERGKELHGGREFTALEIARDRHKTEVVSVLERFLANPALTRHELRVRFGMLDALAAEVFALTVFLCDDLLQLKPAATDPATTSALRFYTIVSKLPMELQMILCCRVVGSTNQNILSKDSEPAFKALARTFLVIPPPPSPGSPLPSPALPPPSPAPKTSQNSRKSQQCIIS